MNDANIDFYRNIKIETFKELAAVTGFDTCKDIDLIFPYLEKARTVLELGAGYGRAIQALLDRGLQGKLIAVERVPELLTYLREHIPPSVSLQEQDFKHLAIEETFDAVLWLWSGILELSKDEQRDSIIHISQHLYEGGILIIEIPRQIKKVGVHIGDQQVKVETEWGRLDAYWPRHEEMVAFAQMAGFQAIETINYNSATGLDRIIYLLRK